MTKLEILAQQEGFSDPLELLEANIIDSVVPGICMNPNCEYSTGVEPDSGSGFCEICGTYTVKSCMVLGEII